MTSQTIREAEQMKISCEEIDPAELEVLERVGTGSTAEVFRGFWRGRQVAIKQMRPGRKGELAFEREASVMTKLPHHPNLVRLFGLVSKRPPLRIVTEFCEGECCFELLHGENPPVDLSWAQKAKMATDVAVAMRILHDECAPQIMHRDLKSLNLLLAKPIHSETDTVLVKLADFGSSRVKQSGKNRDDHNGVPTTAAAAPTAPAAAKTNNEEGLTDRSCCRQEEEVEEHQQQPWLGDWSRESSWGNMTVSQGTMHWMAPEVHDNTQYDEKADVYSYAMFLFEIICQEIPFQDEAPGAIGGLTVKGRRPDLGAVPKKCPPALRELMLCCWAQNSSDRPCFREVVAELLSEQAKTTSGVDSDKDAGADQVHSESPPSEDNVPIMGISLKKKGCLMVSTGLPCRWGSFRRGRSSGPARGSGLL